MNGFVLERDRVGIESREDFRQAVLAGLTLSPRAISAKYLYDARGSSLFDQICALPEYYLTRAETAILAHYADEIAALAGPRCALIEFGAGSSVKSRLLLDAMALTLYAPIDISAEHLEAAATRLRRDYGALKILPITRDYMTVAALPQIPQGVRRVGFFPGSSIGNFDPSESKLFLKHARRLLGPDGVLVLGVDLKKDPARLHAAYNDSAGVTAAFTLNLLRRINRELQGNFDLGKFVHDASYNPVDGRIEIYFRSLCDQTVSVSGKAFFFAAGERVHTEYSYKYDMQGLEALAQAGGFRIQKTWTDAERLFAVTYLTVMP